VRRLPIVLAGSALLAGILFSLPQPAALAQQTQAPPKAAKSQPSAQTTTATLDRMTAAGKSPQELAQYVFETHGCKSCHNVGQNGKLGFTEKGKQVGQGSEGCISLLTAMNLVAQVRENERSPQQRQRAARFEEFGCTLCHRIVPGKMGLTEVGSRLTHLHLGCVEIEQLVASRPAKKR
jgi:cytochrome c551/c552